jgi:hypothetical protein
MAYPRNESAQWSQAVRKHAAKRKVAVEKALNENAARGFSEPTGPTLQTILKANVEFQDALVEENAKIYADQRELIQNVEDFALKMSIEIAKLAMEWFKAELLRQLGIEAAEYDAQVDRWRGDIIRVNAEIEQRGVALIRLKADIEHEINIYKRQQLDAEFLTLDAELVLIEAKIDTARAKLEIVDSLRMVIAAEQLVIAAEQRRAAALELVIQAKTRLAEVQRTMIPMYLSKAAARQDLALATTAEADVKRQIEELGYDRLELKDAQENADHSVRQAELDYELSRELLVQAEKAVELLRNQSRRILSDYANAVKASLIYRAAALKKTDINLRIDTTYERKRMDTAADVALMNFLQGLAGEDFINKLDNLREVGVDNCRTIRDGAHQVHTSATWTLYVQRVRKGTAYIVGPTGGSGSFGNACA